MHVIYVTTFAGTGADNTQKHQDQINAALDTIPAGAIATITLHHSVTLIEQHRGDGSSWLYSTLIQYTI